VGHWGVEETLKRVQAHQKWDFQRQHVTRFVKQCPVCQKLSVLKPCIETRPFTLATYRKGQRYYVDTIGPLPATAKGNQFILVVIDAFTRYVELAATESTDAAAAADALTSVFARLGVPEEMVSDRGTQFINELIAAYCKLAKINHIMTTAHSKEENGMVERANKEVMRHLRAFVFDHRIQDAWDRYLPFVMRIINTKRHESTGQSPATLTYIDGASMESSLFADWSSEQKEAMNLPEWVDKMMSAQQTLIRIAQENQLEKDLRHLARAPAEGALTHYPVDSMVLVAYPSEGMRKSPPNKVMTNLRGPMRVVDKDGEVYKVLDLTNNKVDEVHVSRLRPFLYDPEHVDPQAIALADKQTFIVEAVRRHEFGTPGKPTTMRFLVKWEGYPECENTWEPWKNLRLNVKLHQYLRANDLAELVPKGY
jgi:hypothetical protein